MHNGVASILLLIGATVVLLLKPVGVGFATPPPGPITVQTTTAETQHAEHEQREREITMAREDTQNGTKNQERGKETAHVR